MFTTLAGHHHELTGIFADARQRVADARGETSRDLNTPYTFPGYSKAEWEKRAASLRQQILVATGLVPTAGTDSAERQCLRKSGTRRLHRRESPF